MIRAVAALLLAAGAPAAAPRLLTAALGVVDGARDDAGAIWFASWTPGVGFLLTPPDRAAGDAAFAMLQAAAKNNATLTVRFDPASGRYDPARGRVMLEACAITGEGRTIGLPDARCPAAAPLPGAERSLSLGVALAEADRAADALPWLDVALRDERTPERRVLALRTREAARESAAASVPAGRVRDEQLVGALSDAREWAALAPDDAEAALAGASSLALLGAADEAIAQYRAVATRWPAEDYRAAVRVGAIERARRDYPRALAALDALVTLHGPQDGMKLHYHRGWTLALMGRDADAVAELDAGLKEQPDYWWARVWRACALGRLGRVREAAADQRAAVAAMAAYRTALGKPPSGDQTNWRAAQAAAVALDGAAATPPTAPTPVGCAGYLDEEARAGRSPLLP